jgi:hypothetical protein
MNNQKAYLVADGKAISVDTVAKRVTMKVNKMLYHDQNFGTTEPKDLLLDVSVASVTRDTGVGKLSDVKAGTNIVAVSYAEALKSITPSEVDSLPTIIKKLPTPVPIDEIKIMETEEQKKAREDKASQTNKPFDWVSAMLITLGVIAGFIVLLFASPWLIWQYYNTRAKGSSNARAKAYNTYMASIYYLNQLGITRENQSPQQFAEATDKRFGTNFNSFTNIYQKIKYSKQQLNEKDVTAVGNFYPAFKQKVRASIPFKTRFSRFLNIYNTLHFFTKPKIS